MLFNSYVFIFVFLPITVLGYYAFRHYLDQRPALAWLLLCSLVFYGAWDWRYVILISCSILLNFYCGFALSRAHDRATVSSNKMILAAGILVNLAALGYYKYLNFFVDNLNLLADSDFFVAKILLPIGISFFTFQQIAFLVDCYRGQAKDYSFINYAVFVTFFPQLIAGPIVHHKEMMPQFNAGTADRDLSSHVACGIVIFSFGLFKKIAIADEMAKMASPVFAAADGGGTVTFLDAWFGTLGYSFQIYFDFSGYSDMAIGLALLFGVRLPINFSSPYKATSIIEFWQSWHITLSRFLRDYVYIPLGGNRNGKLQRYRNLLLTMVIGGVWHGAGWNFMIWGGFHGSILAINHLWRSLKGPGAQSRTHSLISTWAARLATFTLVALAWIFFRAETTSGALEILKGALGLNGISMDPAGWISTLPGIDRLGIRLEGDIVFSLIGLAQIIGCFLVVWCLPNLYQLLSGRGALSALALRFGLIGSAGLSRDIEDKTRGGQIFYPLFSPRGLSALPIALFFYYTILQLNNPSEFIYFQF